MGDKTTLETQRNIQTIATSDKKTDLKLTNVPNYMRTNINYQQFTKKPYLYELM